MWNEETEDRCATPQEACWEYARNVGRESRDLPWILTDYDTYERNPYYIGPKCMRDGVDPYNPDSDFLDEHAACCEAGKCLLGYGDPKYGPVYDNLLAGKVPGVVDDDDIPF